MEERYLRGNVLFYQKMAAILLCVIPLYHLLFGDAWAGLEGLIREHQRGLLRNISPVFLLCCYLGYGEILVQIALGVLLWLCNRRQVAPRLQKAVVAVVGVEFAVNVATMMSQIQSDGPTISYVSQLWEGAFLTWFSIGNALVWAMILLYLILQLVTPTPRRWPLTVGFVVVVCKLLLAFILYSADWLGDERHYLFHMKFSMYNVIYIVALWYLLRYLSKRSCEMLDARS